MARIKYIDKDGEHEGTLTLAEYYVYSTREGEKSPYKITDTIPYFSWDDTDYEPFKRAVNKKYNTTCEKAWLI